MKKNVEKCHKNISYRIQTKRLPWISCLLDGQTKSFKSLPEFLQRFGFNLDNKTNCIIQIS